MDPKLSRSCHWRVSDSIVVIFSALMTCGSFGGNVGHDGHMLYTLSAVQILAMYGELALLDVGRVVRFVSGLQQPDGSFYGDKWGEIDSRFSYCALNTLALLGELNSGAINVEKAVEYVARYVILHFLCAVTDIVFHSCKNFDGGFGAVPGAESHAGQIFCCVAALSICNALHHVDEQLLGWWLSERQCDSGGLNGRPEKQADVCYSWWILSALSILGRVIVFVDWFHDSNGVRRLLGLTQRSWRTLLWTARMPKMEESLIVLAI